MLSTAYRYFRDNGISGRIAAVTSVAGTNGIGRLSAYSSSKKGAQAYMVALEQLANEEGAKVSFTDIRPGWIRTPLLRPGLKYPMEMDLDYAVPQIIKAIVQHPRVAVEYSSRSLATRTEHGVDKSKDENLDSRHPVATTVFASLCLYGFRARGIAA